MVSIKNIGRLIAINKTPLKHGMGIGLLIYSVGDGIWRTYKFSKETDNRDIKKLIKVYAPTVITTATGTLLLLSSAKDWHGQNAALLAALALSDNMDKDYKNEVKKLLSPKQQETIKDNIAAKKMSQVAANEEIYETTRGGNHLVYDSVFGRLFRSDVQAIDSAVNVVNDLIIRNGYASLNDFYTELGLDNISPLGDELGWSNDTGLMDITKSAQIHNDEPCIVLTYHAKPVCPF